MVGRDGLYYRLNKLEKTQQLENTFLHIIENVCLPAF